MKYSSFAKSLLVKNSVRLMAELGAADGTRHRLVGYAPAFTRADLDDIYAAPYLSYIAEYIICYYST